VGQSGRARARRQPFGGGRARGEAEAEAEAEASASPLPAPPEEPDFFPPSSPSSSPRSHASARATTRSFSSACTEQVEYATRRAPGKLSACFKAESWKDASFATRLSRLSRSSLSRSRCRCRCPSPSFVVVPPVVDSSAAAAAAIDASTSALAVPLPEHGAHRGEFGIERVKLQEVRDLGSHDLARPGALGGALEGLEPGGVAVEGEDAAPFADES
jgi:hypothetical protein